ncbi:hypothetical protein [Pantoea dispersa]|uniref:hypothetical protein n=1 Tax=Pantoea dispersa TaxID=59814 RepID=UPI0021F7808A|nr:hypothetical protein [Pantoea dispersa]
MVNKVLSRYNTSPPKELLTDGVERAIDGGPLYKDILEVLAVSSIQLVTQKCSLDLALHNLDVGEVREWIEEAVAKGRYVNSQWCAIQGKNCIAACDAYLVSGFIELKNGEKELKDMYIKFSVSKTGTAVLTVSFHESSFSGVVGYDK